MTTKLGPLTMVPNGDEAVRPEDWDISANDGTEAPDPESDHADDEDEISDNDGTR